MDKIFFGQNPWTPGPGLFAEENFGNRLKQVPFRA
jgi:hypothetical protein